MKIMEGGGGPKRRGTVRVVLLLLLPVFSDLDIQAEQFRMQTGNGPLSLPSLSHHLHPCSHHLRGKERKKR